MTSKVQLTLKYVNIYFLLNNVTWNFTFNKFESHTILLWFQKIMKYMI